MIYLMEVMRQGEWQVCGSKWFPGARAAIDELAATGWTLDRVRVRQAPTGYEAPQTHRCPCCGVPDNHFPTDRYEDFTCEACEATLSRRQT